MNKTRCRCKSTVRMTTLARFGKSGSLSETPPGRAGRIFTPFSVSGNPCGCGSTSIANPFLLLPLAVSLDLSRRASSLRSGGLGFCIPGSADTRLLGVGDRSACTEGSFTVVPECRLSSFTRRSSCLSSCSRLLKSASISITFFLVSSIIFSSKFATLSSRARICSSFEEEALVVLSSCDSFSSRARICSSLQADELLFLSSVVTFSSSARI
mmetsp:Transcript_21795/g.88763  ORF Transcript_21795/g.88763 Transcript_21795/m.88763 type:complete len:212 (+) Transcript_21795:836-1471(+)